MWCVKRRRCLRHHAALWLFVSAPTEADTTWRICLSVTTATHVVSARGRRETDDMPRCVNHRSQPGGSVWWRKTGSSLFVLIQMGICWIVQILIVIPWHFPESPQSTCLFKSCWLKWGLRPHGIWESYRLHPIYWSKGLFVTSVCLVEKPSHQPDNKVVEKHWAFLNEMEKWDRIMNDE